MHYQRHPFSQPRFQTVGRSGRGVFRGKRWVFGLLYVFLCSRPPIHTGELSKSTHSRPNLPHLDHSRCGRPGEVSLCRENARLCLFSSIWCFSQHHYPLATLHCRRASETTPDPSNQPRSVYLRFELWRELRWVVSKCTWSSLILCLKIDVQNSLLTSQPNPATLYCRRVVQNNSQPLKLASLICSRWNGKFDSLFAHLCKSKYKF
jgi:hypothetical protein